MVMWKPDVKRHGSVKIAEERWASTLTHEFTHAFVSRYRTNRRIPRWLNEGLAEVISQRSFPEPESYAFAKRMAEIEFQFEYLFDDRMMPGGAMYPVMQTLVEALIKENRKAFRNMFDDIKDGVEPNDAIKKHFKVGEKELEMPWRRYVKGLKTGSPEP
jgi:hypothetical protein